MYFGSDVYRPIDGLGLADREECLHLASPAVVRAEMSNFVDSISRRRLRFRELCAEHGIDLDADDGLVQLGRFLSGRIERQLPSFDSDFDFYSCHVTPQWQSLRIDVELEVYSRVLQHFPDFEWKPMPGSKKRITGRRNLPSLFLSGSKERVYIDGAAYINAIVNNVNANEGEQPEFAVQRCLWRSLAQANEMDLIANHGGPPREGELIQTETKPGELERSEYGLSRTPAHYMRIVRREQNPEMLHLHLAVGASPALGGLDTVLAERVELLVSNQPAISKVTRTSPSDWEALAPDLNRWDHTELAGALSHLVSTVVASHTGGVVFDEPELVKTEVQEPIEVARWEFGANSGSAWQFDAIEYRNQPRVVLSFGAADEFQGDDSTRNGWATHITDAFSEFDEIEHLDIHGERIELHTDSEAERTAFAAAAIDAAIAMVKKIAPHL